MDFRIPASRLPVPAFVAAACLLADPSAARGPYAEGETVRVTGTVADSAGRPVEHATVQLEVARVAWRLRSVNLHERGRSVVDETTVRATTDAAGRFAIDWRWHDYYNRFAVTAGSVTPVPDGERFHEMTRVDLTDRIRQGSPVVVNLTIDEAGAAATSRVPEALGSSDERRVHEQLGQPERVETFDRPDYQEVTWWYFRLGRAYRFRHGALVQVVPFPPVEPF